MDEKMVYFDARPSAHLPTLEVRVSDVAPTVDDAVLIAGLIRGLAGVALADVAAGRSAEPISELAVRAANWTAARGGLSGTCLDPVSRRSLPARDLAGRLLERAAPALAAWGELAEVGELLRASLDGGCGADRQRVAFRDGGMAAVVDMLVARTAPAVADRVGGEHDHTP
jgi:carboxylate-amine ligase